jgi:thiamine-monophosphate kinase
MSETQLIEQIRKMAAGGQRPSILKSIGDDCAIVRPPKARDLVFTTDFVLQDRHFTLESHSASEIGHKALARSLSDLAATGAEPLFCLVSLALPAPMGSEFVPRFYKGLLALAKKYDVSLAGGDLASFPQVVADVMCCGTVGKGKGLLRSAAKPGDYIYVTGSLGYSALGFRSKEGPAWKRHKLPIPRIEAGLELRKLGVRCAMDTSDGLSLDLARLCKESNVSADLVSMSLPLARHATLEEGLHGGEDYELLFTAPERMKVPKKVGGVSVTVIGRMRPQSAVLITLDGNPLPQQGFDHFV